MFHFVYIPLVNQIIEGHLDVSMMSMRLRDNLPQSVHIQIGPFSPSRLLLKKLIYNCLFPSVRKNLLVRQVELQFW